MKKIRHIQLLSNIWSIFADDDKSAKYRKYYSDDSFWGKLKQVAKTAGMKVIYPAMLLHYIMKSNEVSLKSKLIISAALGYFVLPIDFIPDFAPLIGFTDDAGVLLLVLRQMAKEITPEIRKNAREHLHRWFKSADDLELDALDQEYMK